MSLFAQDKSPEADFFWAETEERLGVKVVARGMGRYLQGPVTDLELWGLVYTTEDRLVYHHFPQSNWFSSMLGSQRASQSSARKTTQSEIELFFPFTEYSSMQLVAPELRGLARIFSSPSPTLVVSDVTASGSDGLAAGSETVLLVEYGAKELGAHLQDIYG